VTEGTRNAIPSDIGVYNSYVTTEASSLTTALAGAGINGVTWEAIASTGIAARDNVGGAGLDLTSPIYRTDGVLVALDEADLFDGSILAPIRTTQTGDDVTPGEPGTGAFDVWTGSSSNGTPFANQTLGDLSDASRWGFGEATSGDWLSGTFTQNNELKHLYGISSALTVPSGQAVPEPSVPALLGLGLVAMVIRRPRRKASA